MKTVSILQYDHDGHQFFPSFVVHDDLEDSDTECAFDEVVIHPSDEWMEEYLQWNRFSRLPDDPIIEEDEYLDDDHTAIPIFKTLAELHEFNHKGSELTERLASQLADNRCIQVDPFQPLFSDMAVGPIAAWWHVKDRNYGFVVPLQKLPISDELKAQLQAFRFHKSMGLWRDPITRRQLREEGQELERQLVRELNAEPPQSDESCASDVCSGGDDKSSTPVISPKKMVEPYYYPSSSLPEESPRSVQQIISSHPAVVVLPPAAVE